jgi:hypothetical protein
MSDLALTWNGQAVDLDLSGHRGNIISGDDAVDQNLRIRLKFFLSEWFLDQRLGIPFFREVLVKNPNLQVVRAIFRTAILDTPGVASVDSLELSLDNVTRTLTINFQATLDSGGVLIYNPFIIEV